MTGVNESILFEMGAHVVSKITGNSDVLNEFNRVGMEDIVIGPYYEEPEHDAFILYSVSEFLVHTVGNGQAFYEINLTIECLSTSPETAHRIAKAVSGVYPKRFGSEREIITSSITGKKFSVSPWSLEDSRVYPRQVHQRICTDVYQSYSFQVYEVI